MHFCKPNLEYFEEVLSFIDRKPEECLMVGNDVEEDLAAGALGMKTYLVEDFILDRGRAQNRPDFRSDFKALVDFMGSDGILKL